MPTRVANDAQLHAASAAGVHGPQDPFLELALEAVGRELHVEQLRKLHVPTRAGVTG
jgi:hypothetical protein